ncbi:hypothetical protein KKF61_03715 [Patescibacteria group bacterium]|nr:hypothetical protein [Patescibacteria group bacterium]
MSFKKFICMTVVILAYLWPIQNQAIAESDSSDLRLEKYGSYVQFQYSNGDSLTRKNSATLPRFRPFIKAWYTDHLLLFSEIQIDKKTFILQTYANIYLKNFWQDSILVFTIGQVTNPVMYLEKNLARILL